MKMKTTQVSKKKTGHCKCSFEKYILGFLFQFLCIFLPLLEAIF